MALLVLQDFFFFKFIYSLNGFDLGGESGARYPLHGAHSSPSRTPQSADWWGKKQATKVNLLIAQGCGRSPFTGAGGDSSHVRHLARWPSGERSLKVFGAHTEAGRRGPRANRPSAALLKPRGSPSPEGSPGSSSSLCCAPRVGATWTHVKMVNSPLPEFPERELERLAATSPRVLEERALLTQGFGTAPFAPESLVPSTYVCTWPRVTCGCDERS